jgi:hypothetical protein
VDSGGLVDSGGFWQVLVILVGVWWSGDSGRSGDSGGFWQVLVILAGLIGCLGAFWWVLVVWWILLDSGRFW